MLMNQGRTITSDHLTIGENSVGMSGTAINQIKVRVMATHTVEAFKHLLAEQNHYQ